MTKPSLLLLRRILVQPAVIAGRSTVTTCINNSSIMKHSTVALVLMKRSQYVNVIVNLTNVQQNRYRCIRYSSSSDTNSNSFGNTKNNNSTAYQIFNIPQQFSINEDELKLKYHELMKQLHPDKKQQQQLQDGTNNNDNDDGTSVHSNNMNDDVMASKITDAYNTLKRPHLRAIHLLRIMITTMENKERTTMNYNNNINDDDDDTFMKQFDNAVTNDFLLHIMEVQEEIADMSNNNNNNKEVLQQYFTTNQQCMEQCYTQLQMAYINKDIPKFVTYTIQLKYYTRIDETLRNKM